MFQSRGRMREAFSSKLVESTRWGGCNAPFLRERLLAGLIAIELVSL